MFKLSQKSRMAKAAAAVAAVGSIAGIGLAGTSPAHADPKQYEAIIGMGSDTTQDVLNAFAGFSNGVNYVPLQSSTASNLTQVVSFNAGATSCITPKVGAPSILRPNGSTGGRRALSKIGLGDVNWGLGSPCGAKDMSGLIDFARSSSGPSGAGTDLTYVPFARDALTWAVYRNSGAVGNDTTRANLDTIFTNGTGLIGGVPTIPCGIQTSSGSYSSWNTAVGVSATEMEDGTALCRGLLGVPDGTGRLQEHSGPELKIKGDLIVSQSSPLCDGVVGGASVSCANVQVIVGFSAAQFIARSNGWATPAPGPGVSLGRIAGNQFVTGTAPNVTAVAAGYADTIFGRDVYNVFLTPFITDPSNELLNSMFVGPTSDVCTADATVSRFGFIPLPDAECGTTTLQGPYVTGNS